MQKLAVLVFFFLGGISFSQEPVDWFNIPYNPGDIREFSSIDYAAVNGNVSHISETIENIRTDKSIVLTKIEAKFSPEGNIDSIEEIREDGSIIKRTYVYDSAGKFEYEIFRHYFKADGNEVQIDQDTLYTSFEIFPADSVKRDEAGNVVYLAYRNYEVFSSFDKYGRKIQDVIPGNDHVMAHKITYVYKRKKFVRYEVYPEQNLKIKTSWRLDRHKNWVKKNIESNNKLQNVVVKREISYF